MSTSSEANELRCFDKLPTEPQAMREEVTYKYICGPNGRKEEIFYDSYS